MNKKKQMLTVMFIDLVDYTKTSGKLNLDSLDELHHVFDALVIRSVGDNGGKIVKKIGDAFLITFSTATSAIHCGIDLQNKFANYNRKNPYSLPLKLRIAIHTGEILFRGADIYGETVNLTSRIEGITKPGDIIFSGAVYSTMDSNSIPPFTHLGLRRFKGVKKKTRLFRIKNQRDITKERRQKLMNVMKKIFKWVITLGLLGAAVYVAAQIL